MQEADVSTLLLARVASLERQLAEAQQAIATGTADGGVGGEASHVVCDAEAIAWQRFAVLRTMRRLGL